MPSPSSNQDTGPWVDVQIATDDEKDIPSQEDFERWVSAALPDNKQDRELTVRIVDNGESQQLNATYRQKDKPTNVLSFPVDLPPEVNLPLLGDLVICAQVVSSEALAQNKSIDAHWAHMIIHGTLHLLGYDHISDEDANTMESLEKEIMHALGLPNPYRDDIN